jgi:segregation and condensation protein B
LFIEENKQMQDGPSGLIEALIFASPEPVSAQRLAEVVGDLKSEEVVALVAELNALYDHEGHSFRIVKAAGGYRFATLPEFGRWVKQLLAGTSRVRLTRASLETLSLIAYRQPVSRADIESVRRVDADGVLKLLLDRRLIKIAGRGKGAGRPLLYGTTQEFLKHFGLDSLADLPQISELATGKADIGEEPELFTE